MLNGAFNPLSLGQGPEVGKFLLTLRFRRALLSSRKNHTNRSQAFVMREHLQRALVEVLYAIAEFNEAYATAPRDELRAETCARLFVVKANLERLLACVSEQADGMKRAA